MDIQDLKNDNTILRHALKTMTGQLNGLIGACLDDTGKPKAPDMRAVMKAKGMLPGSYEHAFVAKEKKK